MNAAKLLFDYVGEMLLRICYCMRYLHAELEQVEWIECQAPSLHITAACSTSITLFMQRR